MFEAGLQDYAGFIGFAEAVEYLEKIGMEEIERHEKRLNSFISKHLINLGFNIIGPKDGERRGGITSFFLSRASPHEIAMLFDEMANIMVRAGKHCVHSWFNAHGIEGSVRASFYLYNTMTEAKIFVECAEKIIGIFS